MSKGKEREMRERERERERGDSGNIYFQYYIPSIINE